MKYPYWSQEGLEQAKESCDQWTLPTQGICKVWRTSSYLKWPNLRGKIENGTRMGRPPVSCAADTADAESRECSQDLAIENSLEKCAWSRLVEGF